MFFERYAHVSEIEVSAFIVTKHLLIIYIRLRNCVKRLYLRVLVLKINMATTIRSGNCGITENVLRYDGNTYTSFDTYNTLAHPNATN